VRAPSSRGTSEGFEKVDSGSSLVDYEAMSDYEVL